MEDKGRQQTNPSTPLATESTINFSNEEIAAGLVVAASLLIVGTIVEDFLTAGIGVADDPVSFATAATMHARAATVMARSNNHCTKSIITCNNKINYNGCSCW